MDIDAQMLVYLVNIIVGFLTAYFTYSIYRKTEGGSRGWGYLAIVGALLGMYSIVGTFNQMMGISSSQNTAKMIIDFIAYGGFAVVLPIGLLTLVNDLKIKRPGFLSQRNIRIYFCGILGILFLYNFILTQPPSIAGELVSLSMAMIIFTSPLVAYLSYLLAKETNLTPWKIVMLGAICMFIASGMEQVSSNACGGWAYNDVLNGYLPPEAMGIPECSGFGSELMFGVIVPTGGLTNPLMVLVGLNDIGWILTGLLNLVAFLLIWKSMR